MIKVPENPKSTRPPLPPPPPRRVRCGKCKYVMSKPEFDSHECGVLAFFKRLFGVK